MSKYTIEQLKSALVEADAAGDTKSAQILADELASRQAESYVQEPERTSLMGDMWTGLKRGAVDEFEKLGGGIFAPVVPENVLKAAQDGNLSQVTWAPNKHAMRDQMAKPETTAGKVAEVVPELLMSLPGWGMGAGGLKDVPALAKMAEKPLGWIADKALKGVAGTLGADVTTGESPTNALEGGAANVLAETIFHVPVGLKFMKGLLAKNDADILAAADHIGATPTVGMVSNRAWIRTLENMLGKVPGAGLIDTAHAKTQAAMASFAEQIKSALGNSGDSSQTGRNIREALDNYRESFKKDAEAMYDKVYDLVPQYSKLNTNKLADTIGEMKARYSHDTLSKLLDSPFVKEIYNMVEAMPGGTTAAGRKKAIMSIGEARALLQRINEAIGTGMDSAFKNMSEADLSRLAGALSDDISQAFNARGFGKSWEQVQDYYAAHRAIVDEAEKVMGMAKTGDEVYVRLFGNQAGAFKPIGADSIRAIKAAMTPEQFNQVAGEIVHRMGQESAGMAAAGGREFSANTFLTNWNKLSPEAKAELFSSQHANDLEQLAKLAEGVKRLGRDANHSNTAHHAAMWSLLTGAIISPIHGIPALIGVPAGAKLSSLLFTNPQAARLLVEASQAASPQAFKGVMVRMLALAATNPELAQAFATLGDDGQ